MFSCEICEIFKNTFFSQNSFFFTEQLFLRTTLGLLLEGQLYQLRGLNNIFYEVRKNWENNKNAMLAWQWMNEKKVFYQNAGFKYFFCNCQDILRLQFDHIAREIMNTFLLRVPFRLQLFILPEKLMYFFSMFPFVLWCFQRLSRGNIGNKCIKKTSARI